MKPDILGRTDIETLVNAFYKRVRSDPVLSRIFDEVARIEWSAHLPKMHAFWETVLFRSGGYNGNPLAAHASLTLLTDMGRDKFERWLSLFQTTVDDLFTGERADHIKNCAADMASVIHSRINDVPAVRLQPASFPPVSK